MNLCYLSHCHFPHLSSEFRKPFPGLIDVVLDMNSPNSPMPSATPQAHSHSSIVCQGPPYPSQGNTDVAQCMGDEKYMGEGKVSTCYLSSNIPSHCKKCLRWLAKPCTDPETRWMNGMTISRNRGNKCKVIKWNEWQEWSVKCLLPEGPGDLALSILVAKAQR